MSFMTHTAHGAAPMGQQTRKVLSGATITLMNLTLGKYIIHGRFGDNVNSVADYPVVQNVPIELKGRWPASMGYIMLVDVDAYSPANAPFNLEPYVSAVALRKITLTVIPQTIPQDTRLWNNNAGVQGTQMQQMGIMKWETTITGIPDPATAGSVIWTWGLWQAITANVSKTNAMVPHTSINGYYVLDLSISTNWQLSDYNPSIPITIRVGLATGSAMWGAGAGNFDGIVTLTLNTIAATGTPTFSPDAVNGYPAPSWIESAYTATAGKRGRLIFDYSGGLATVMGIDLASTTTLG